MVNGTLNFRPAPLDLRLEQRDPLLELLDRKRIEILLGQLRDKVVLATRKIFVGFHGGANSARAGAMSIRAGRSQGISEGLFGHPYGEAEAAFLR